MHRKHKYIFIVSIFILSFNMGYCTCFIRDSIPFVAHYNTSDLRYTKKFNVGRVVGLINDDDIDEASGIVCGRRNKKILYSMNDHGNENKLFLISHNGVTIATFYIGFYPNRDWESIAIDNNNKCGKPYIYIADIGDNQSQYKKVYIYRIAEPVIPIYHDTIIRIHDVKRYVLTYPDGSHNAETFFIDPISKNWYIISKGKRAKVYCAEYPQNSNDTLCLKYLGILPFPYLTDGDITFNGMELVLKDYKNIYYWKRRNINETISELLQKAPYKVPYIPEVHGESVGWTWNASGFYTTSEKRGTEDPRIYFYKRNN